MQIPAAQIDALLWLAIAEDCAQGDCTGEGLFGYDPIDCNAVITANAPGILAGTDIADRCFELMDANVHYKMNKQDRDPVQPGDVIAEINGSAKSILQTERIALNLLSHLSGIATLTRSLVDAVEGHSVHILDTRKTLPGLRSVEKYAVTVGGGYNHRLSLSDMGMIKDNHIQIYQKQFPNASFSSMVAKIKQRNSVPVTLEIDSLDQIEDAKNSGAEIIILDNFSTEQLRSAVDKLKDTDIQLEASGNICLETAAEIAATGVHRMSVGRLTHSAKALDFSMDVRN